MLRNTQEKKGWFCLKHHLPHLLLGFIIWKWCRMLFFWVLFPLLIDKCLTQIPQACFSIGNSIISQVYGVFENKTLSCFCIQDLKRSPVEPGLFLFWGITLVLRFIEAHYKVATRCTLPYVCLKLFACWKIKSDLIQSETVRSELITARRKIHYCCSSSNKAPTQWLWGGSLFHRATTTLHLWPRN